MKFSTFVFCALTCASFTCAHAGEAPAKSDSGPEMFFKNRQFGTAVLSPDAKNLAVTSLGDGRLHLDVIDVETRKVTPLAGYGDADICSVHWISNDRLVFDLQDVDGKYNSTLCSNGLFAVNRDGSKLVELVSTYRKQIDHMRMAARLGAGFTGVLTSAYYMDSYNDGTNILVSEHLWNTKNDYSVYKLNTLTGKKQEIFYNLPGIPLRFIDDNQQRLRVVMSRTEDKKSSTVWYRDDTDKPWRRLAEIDNFNPAFLVAGFDSDNKTMYVRSRGDGDKWGLYKYDFAKNQVGEKIISDPGVDVGNILIDYVSHRLVGARIDSEPPRTHWLDPDYAKAQEEVDSVFPDRINVLTSGESSALILVRSYSAVNPGEYYLYDPAKKKIEFLFKNRPWIKPEDMSDQLVYDYNARDGLHIPAYLTTPKGKALKSLPLVVYVHDNPYGRDYFGFDPVVQYLSSLGYAVLQPQYRGSGGFGREHFVKGWKTWGLAMQDDITDGVQDLVKQGVVDPDKVCIMGAGYGGYASLMGLIKEPKLFRCGIDLLGITDLNLVFTMGSWSSDDDDIYSNSILIGDPGTMKEQFDATSPLKHADKINAPVFMAYGKEDFLIPIAHGERMRDALKEKGQHVEWMEFPDEAHGFVKEEDRYKVFGAIGKFLKTYNPVD